MKKSRFLPAQLTVLLLPIAILSGGCWYDKFEALDSQSGTGGVSASSGGQGESGGMAGSTSDGGSGSTPNGAGGSIQGTSPQAVDDFYTIVQGTTLSKNVLDNDTGSSISVIATDEADADRPPILDAEEFSISASGELTFRPHPDFWGIYRANYSIENSSGSTASAEILIRVIPLNIDLSYVEAGYGGFVIDGAIDDLLGSSLSNAGDIDRDELDDFILGAPGANSGEGRAIVVFGNPTLSQMDLEDVAALKVQVLLGDGVNLAAGISVAGAGDLNADGFDDFVVGAAEPGQDGRIYAVYGSPSFPGPERIFSDTPSSGIALLGEAGNRTGLGVGAGNFDGDSKRDLVAFSPAAGSDVSYIRAAYSPLQNGSFSSESDLKFAGDSAEQLQSTFVVPGDLFGNDGREEILVASLSRITLLRGPEVGQDWPSPVGTVSDPSDGWQSSPVNSSDKSVASAGEFDGSDGRDLSYCLGTRLDAQPSACLIVSWMPSGEFSLDQGWNIGGFSEGSAPQVSGEGDFNADGYDDLIFHDGRFAYLLWGRNALPTSDLDVSALGDNGISIKNTGSNFERAVLVGDINGDGFFDLALTEPDYGGGRGRVFVVFGN